MGAAFLCRQSKTAIQRQRRHLQDLYLHILKRLMVLRMIADLMNDRSADDALYRSQVQKLSGGTGISAAGGNTNRSMSKLRKCGIVPIRPLASAGSGIFNKKLDLICLQPPDLLALNTRRLPDFGLPLKLLLPKDLPHGVELADQLFFESSNALGILEVGHQERGLLFSQAVDCFRSAALAPGGRFSHFKCDYSKLVKVGLVFCNELLNGVMLDICMLRDNFRSCIDLILLAQKNQGHFVFGIFH